MTNDKPSKPSRSFIPVEVTPDQRAAIKGAAERDGLGAGPWLRRLGLVEARRVEMGATMDLLGVDVTYKGERRRVIDAHPRTGRLCLDGGIGWVDASECK